MHAGVGVRIGTNVAALNVHRVLLTSDRAAGRSLERLASGVRVNRAADDAAGLAIGEGLRAQIGGTRQAERNTQDGINLIRTAEGALAETTSVLQRMRDLSVQAANHGALDGTARGAIQLEIDQLSTQLTRIATTTTFNGIRLLDGSYRGVLQVGANAGETLTVDIRGPGGGMDARSLGVDGIDVTRNLAASSSPGTAVVTPAVSDEEGTPAPGRLAFPGDFTSPGTFRAAYEGLNGTILYNGRSFDLAGVDYTGAVDAQDYIDRMSFAALAALGTSHIPVVAASSGLVFGGDTPGAGSTAADGARLSLVHAVAETDVIRAVDQAISRVSALRANLGALENRLRHTASRLAVAAENGTASWSRIRDADMAAEVTALARHQVLVQAGTAMLAQANQAPQTVLRLLD
ncbi:flagellin [Blastococcus xanthinilyticus]|uniref:Flagellin n=2 Tax=Blastococcus xanthinilyticus TaxID=1564164 RepID=A0A5S5D047_9ACTN|nr:flagellin [Blastococcus xanthinilyticus]